MSADNLVFDSLYEVQIKFKLLYFYNSFPENNKLLIQKTRPVMIKLFLKILSLIGLKEVLTGKFRNRLISNYFKKFQDENSRFSISKNNVLFLDSTYSSTVAVSHIYNTCIRK